MDEFTRSDPFTAPGNRPAFRRRGPVWMGLLLSMLALMMVGFAGQPTNRRSIPVQATAAQVLLVTSAADSGPGTLRQALLAGRAGDTIVFDPAVFPSNGSTTIALQSDLPPITQAELSLDGARAGVVVAGSQFNIVSGGPVALRALQIRNDPLADPCELSWIRIRVDDPAASISLSASGPAGDEAAFVVHGLEKVYAEMEQVMGNAHIFNDDDDETCALIDIDETCTVSRQPEAGLEIQAVCQSSRPPVPVTAAAAAEASAWYYLLAVGRQGSGDVGEPYRLDIVVTSGE